MADAVRALFFPVLLAGGVCILLWRRLRRQNRRAGWFLLLGVGLLAVPQFLVLIMGTMATALLLYREVVLAIWLLLFGLFWVWQVVRVVQGRSLPVSSRGLGRTANTVLLGLLTLVLGLVFGGFGAYLAVLSAEDLFLPHQVLEGTITRKWVTRTTRSVPEYHLRLDGHSVRIGRDLYVRVRPGETVRLEVTAGSHAAAKADGVGPAR
ncbi:MAG TPA: hypothetical protein VGX75_16055 [bacterium]|nr:hypothetical protein [bacterium]